jgi:membrane peptidoglycan carboxypeptidase
MPSVPHILQLRRDRSDRKKRRLSNRLRPVGIGCGLFICLGVALGLISAISIYASLTQNLPAIEALPNLIEPPSGVLGEPTRLYDRTGEYVLLSLEDPGSVGREYVPIGNEHGNRLPEFLIQATIASTDPHFNEHAGFSWEGALSGNHPTLAQRLVTDFLLWEEPPSLRRALRERILAWQITDRYGRLKILEWYLNSTRYGNFMYGADAAAR